MIHSLALALAPFVPPSSAAPLAPVADSIEWRDQSLEDALALARPGDGMVMVYAWRSGSEYCTKLYNETLQTPAVAKALSTWTCFSASFDTEQAASVIRELRVETLPTLLFLNGDGTVEDALAGFIDSAGLVAEIERIRRGEGTLSDLRKHAAQADTKDEAGFAARFALAGKLSDLGMIDEHDEVLAGIRADDPKLLTRTGAECHVWLVKDQMAESGGGFEHIKEWDMKPLYELAKRAKGPDARQVVWTAVARTEAGREQLGAAVDAFRQAWKNCANENKMRYGAKVLGWTIETEGELTKKQERFLVSLAEECVELFERMQPDSDEAREYMGEERYEDHHAWFLDRLARTYQRTGQTQDALRTGERVVALAPDRAEYRERLASYR